VRGPPTPQGETKTVFGAKYESLVIRRGHKKTIIAYFNRTRGRPFKWTMTGKPLAA